MSHMDADVDIAFTVRKNRVPQGDHGAGRDEHSGTHVPASVADERAVGHRRGACHQPAAETSLVAGKGAVGQSQGAAVGSHAVQHAAVAAVHPATGLLCVVVDEGAARHDGVAAEVVDSAAPPGKVRDPVAVKGAGCHREAPLVVEYSAAFRYGAVALKETASQDEAASVIVDSATSSPVEMT